MIDWFEKVQRYYKWECYDDRDVADFVSYKKLTPENYKEITGKDYVTE